jgi:hypothetical protein
MILQGYIIFNCYNNCNDNFYKISDDFVGSAKFVLDFGMIIEVPLCELLQYYKDPFEEESNDT